MRDDILFFMDEANHSKIEDDRRAMEARGSMEARNAFLTEEQYHVLHLTARILMRTVTMSDDEWSVALSAVSEAIDGYDEGRGHFWNYAALVMESRLRDHFRSKGRTEAELTVGPEYFSGEFDEDAECGLRIEIQEKTAAVVDTGLRDELDAFGDELNEYGIDLFDLPGQAPKASKTRDACARLILAFFEPPPPLTDELRRTHNLPVKGLMARTGLARKLIDKHRKYLIAAALIKDGDYPGMAEYLPAMTEEQ